MLNTSNQKISIAPMIDLTDRHYRSLMRFISSNTMLYTEMITTNAILNGPKDILLKFSPEELPLTLQLGGNDPDDLALCAKIGEDLGYSAINLNVGCPSERVSKGAFGLSLMGYPEIVARCVDSMKSNVNIPVTIKCRTGYDECDSYSNLVDFLTPQINAGVDYIFIHARKGWLKGLSPKQNRTVPPLQYDTVYKIKQEFPDVQIGINGGIKTVDDIRLHLDHIDGVMIGREAYDNPMFFNQIEKEIFNNKKASITPIEVIERLCEYTIKEMKDDNRIKLNNISRHALNLFNGEPGARLYRRHLSENSSKNGAGIDVFKEAIKYLSF